VKPRKRRLLIALVANLLGLVALQATVLGSTAGAEAHQEPRQPSSAEEVVAAMRPGWNVGNTLDAIPGETSWGNPRITPELLAAIHDQGFNSLRLPVTWNDHQGGAPDYTIDAATLARLTQGREHGVTATLRLRFTRGVPWEVNVINYDTPAVRNATGTTSGLTIPTAFNGDRLATMEAVYADGTNAGPHNWTSYKEYGRTFTPNYAVGQITLKQDFFAEVDDSSTVTLTFHFWSGETLTYTLTRTGTTVTGITA
jgi:hypothetical protein